MVDIIDAARYFVFLSYGRKSYSLTPLKLQKLLYLAQGWSFVWDNIPVFDDDFDAWQYGPVNEKIYDYFRKYGRSEIPESEGIIELGDETIEETLKAVWRDYGGMSAYDLVELTHKQTPWIEAFSKGIRITNSSIQKYFQSTY